MEFGLYSALIPVYGYALFGSSRQLAVGPVALISLLLSSGLTRILEDEGVHPVDGPDYAHRYNRLAVQTSFLVGLCYVCLGLLRLGFVTVFLSHAVVSGFTTGAAVIIGMSQVQYLVGYPVQRSDRLQDLIKYIVEGIHAFNWRTFGMGMLCVAALMVCKHIGKRYARLNILRALGPLCVTAMTIVLTVLFDLPRKGIPVVGTIPSGLPEFTVRDDWTLLQDLKTLLALVISIAIVGFMESIAIAKQLASRHKYEIDASQELIGLGMSVRFLSCLA